jgi:hypothetical protein
MAPPTPAPSTTPSSSSGFGRLEAVASKRKEWAALPLRSKIDLLEQVLHAMTRDLSYDDYKAAGWSGTAMMGYRVALPPTNPDDKVPEDDGEAEYESESQTLSFVIMIMKNVRDVLFCLKVREGLEKVPHALAKAGLRTRTAVNGQIVVRTFPSIPGEKSGLMGHCKGEVWLDPQQVRRESDVQTFARTDGDGRSDDGNNTSTEDGGLMIVLGAGNQASLTPVDILHGLFVKNCVVYVKQHPLRGYMNELTLRMFRPLVERGYLDLEAHTTNERSSALVYHPAVTAVHLTGGKATHDAIVWGATEEERRQNIARGTPKLKAAMTSELGAVSPWIVVPARYTNKAMKTQAKVIAFWINNNASCNCNAPKCLVVADDWDQKEEFLSIVERSLTRHRLPVAYYPGIEQRWNELAARYNGTTGTGRLLESTSGLGIEERHLSAPLLSDRPLLLPYLLISLDVDLRTDAGREAAKAEYAFRTEPFAPVYTVATLKGTSQRGLDQFGRTASTFCNDYLFGTLSGTVTVPPGLLADPSVQRLIADLRYGSLGINGFGGLIYMAQSSGLWGAYPGEKLDNVQSGIGSIGNSLGIPHVQKFVLESPIVHFTHGSLKRDLRTEQKVVQAAVRFGINGSISNLVKLMSTVIGVDLIKVAVLTMSVLVAAAAAYAASRAE